MALAPTPKTPPLPEKLASVRMASLADLSNEESAAIARCILRPAGERYLALRRLEEQDPVSAVRNAEALVLECGASAEERFVAVNALGVLARMPAGDEALVLCAEFAPTKGLRKAAKILIERK